MVGPVINNIMIVTLVNSTMIPILTQLELPPLYWELNSALDTISAPADTLLFLLCQQLCVWWALPQILQEYLVSDQPDFRKYA